MKMHRKKLQAMCFDDLLEDINPPTLKKNLNKMLQFLEGEGLEAYFPYLSEQFEEIIIRIGRDIGVLNSKKLNASYREVCDKIIKIMNLNKNLYELTPLYADRRVSRHDRCLRRTLVLKKEYYNNNEPVKTAVLNLISDTSNHLVANPANISEEIITNTTSIESNNSYLNKENHSQEEQAESPSPSVIRETDINLLFNKDNNFEDESEVTPLSSQYSSMESLATSSSSIEDPNNLLQRSNLSPSSKYKIKCLQKALAFVKNDVIHKIEYPYLYLEQFEYLQRVFKNVLAFSAYEVDFGNKLFYVALYEAIKIYSLKYEFSVKVVGSDDKKTLVFEKTVKPKAAMENIENAEKKRTIHPRILPPEDAANVTKTKKNMPPPLTARTLYLRAPDPTDPESQLSKNKNDLPPPLPTQSLYLRDPNVKIDQQLTKRQQKQNELMKEQINKLPKSFVMDKLNKIIDFLSVETAGTLIWVPYNEHELLFYRKVILWANDGNRKFGNEFDVLFDKIRSLLVKMRCKVPTGKKNKVNEISGLKEVTYKKKVRAIGPPVKAKKVKKMERLDSDNSDRSASCGKSLSKKMKFEEQEPNKITNWRLRPEVENTENDKKNYGRAMLNRRKEQLIEAMSVPIQSDKAMRMMRGMGWSGGALGARGTGITEPIMPALHVRAGAGFGHGPETLKIPNIINNTNKLTNTTNLTKIDDKNNIKNENLANTNWFTDTKWSENTNIDNVLSEEPDFVVQTTKKLLQSKFSFEKLEESLKKLEKGENWNPTPKNIGNEVEFRVDILKSVLELLCTKRDSILLTYNYVTKKDRKIVQNVIGNISNQSKYKFSATELCLFDKIEGFYDRLPGVVVTASCNKGCKEILLNKSEVFSSTQLERFNPKSDCYIQGVINKSVLFFLHSISPVIPVQRFTTTKFKMFILLYIFLYVKGDYEEMVVESDQVLSQRRKRYIECAIEAVNSRIRFGSSQAEIVLSLEIKKHIGDYFLGTIYDHKFTSFTLLKYTEKSNGAVPRPMEAAVSRDSFVSNNSEDSNGLKYSDLENNNEIDNVKREKTDTFEGNFDMKTVKVNNLNEKLKTNAKDHKVIAHKDMVIKRNDNIILKDTVPVDYEILVNSRETVVNCQNNEENEPEIIEIIDDDEIILQLDEAIDDLGKSSQNLQKDTEFNQDFIKKEKDLSEENDTLEYESAHKIDWSKEDVVEINSEDILMVESSGPEDVSMNDDDDDDVLHIVPTTDEELAMDTLETDCDNILNDNLVFSNFKCDKNSYSSVNVTCEIEGKVKVDSKASKIKNFFIVPYNFPSELISKEKAKQVQNNILNSLVTTKELPLLKCHGVQNGALIYSCHNKKTFEWLEKIISVVSGIKIMLKEVNKMALKLHSLIEFDVDYFFSMIELYNKGLSTKDWVVDKTDIHSDYVIFSVKMDSISVNYIQASNLTLFAGVDKVEFSPLWD